jgi:cellulose synthase/poly-beta-1,6-N-acetylglucosamine synthase-like glycosyltransferase
LNDFTDFIEVKKDAMGVCWYTGSGAVLRRSVLEELGGWPVGALCEDVLCSFMMFSRGYNVGYVHEFLQTGLVPDSIVGRKFETSDL